MPMMYGTHFNDTLIGQGGNELIYGFLGNDFIDSGAGNDTVYGGEGSDIILARSGQDLVHGGSDDDYIWGGSSEDMLYGDTGDDYLNGGDHNDQLHGGVGFDTLVGGAGDDTLWGSDDYDASEVDELIGGEGRDRFHLGRFNRNFYDNGGDNDYALIKDFSEIDEIILGEGRYNTRQLLLGTGIYQGSELLAIVQGVGKHQAITFEEVGFTTKATLTSTLSTVEGTFFNLPPGTTFPDSFYL